MSRLTCITLQTLMWFTSVEIELIIVWTNVIDGKHVVHISPYHKSHRIPSQNHVSITK